MIAVVDYATGNLRSVANALRRAGAEFTLTADAALLRRAERVILPGVGEASSAMARLRERELDEVLPTLTCPVLGICIGMQLLCLSSEEGNAECLGVFPTRVRRLPSGTEAGAETGAEPVEKIGIFPAVGSLPVGGALRLKIPSRGFPSRATSITSTPTRRTPVRRQSPRPPTAAVSVQPSNATTSSARSSIPRRAARWEPGSCRIS